MDARLYDEKMYTNTGCSYRILCDYYGELNLPRPHHVAAGQARCLGAFSRAAGGD